VTFKRDVNVTQFNASGAGSNQIQNNNNAALWKISQLSVITSPQQSGVRCVITPPTGIVDTSYFAGTGDSTIGEAYYLEPSDFLQLTWTNGPPGGQGICTFFYEELLG